MGGKRGQMSKWEEELIKNERRKSLFWEVRTLFEKNKKPTMVSLRGQPTKNMIICKTAIVTNHRLLFVS
jgi:hypothetical protein